MAGSWNLYVLELDPGKDEYARWYVGITNDIEQRMYEHYSTPQVDWVARNAPSDHVTVGKWRKSRALAFEQELTALLMHGYGYYSTRGGDYTDLNLHRTPPHDPAEATPELAEALAETDHGELSEFGEELLNGDVGNKITENTPRFVRRDSLKDGRRQSHQLLVYSDTTEIERDARHELEDRLGDDIYKLDVREAIYRAGMENLDDAEAILREWGADI